MVTVSGEGEDSFLDPKPPAREINLVAGDGSKNSVFMCYATEKSDSTDSGAFAGNKNAAIFASLLFSINFHDEVPCGNPSCRGDDGTGQTVPLIQRSSETRNETDSTGKILVCFCYRCFTPFCFSCLSDPSSAILNQHMVHNEGVEVDYPVYSDTDDQASFEKTFTPHTNDIVQERISDWRDSGVGWEGETVLPSGLPHTGAGELSKSPTPPPGMSKKQHGKFPSRAIRGFTPEEVSKSLDSGTGTKKLLDQLQPPMVAIAPAPNKIGSPVDLDKQYQEDLAFALAASMKTLENAPAYSSRRSSPSSDEELKRVLALSMLDVPASNAGGAPAQLGDPTKAEDAEQKKREVSVASSGGEGPAGGPTVRPQRKKTDPMPAGWETAEERPEDYLRKMEAGAKGKGKTG